MNTDSVTARTLLSGDQAFYNQPDYKQSSLQEMDSLKAPAQPIYTHNTESRAWRIAKIICSIVIFPIGIHKLLHAAAAKYTGILPSTSESLTDLQEERGKLNLEGRWKVKRISVDADGYRIDAAIIGLASTLGNGRWVLASNGNGETYEKALNNENFREILSSFQANAIVFNYPGVGSSSGMPSRSAMTKAYKAMLHFLEDQEKGIGATEIIGYGRSMGGAVQGEALRSHTLREDARYVFIKDRTFSTLSTEVSLWISRILGPLVWLIGWNISSLNKELAAPEIVMQRAYRFRPENLAESDTSSIWDDEAIPAKASLAHALLKDKTPLRENQYVMGSLEEHNDSLEHCTREHLTEKVNEMLAAQVQG